MILISRAAHVNAVAVALVDWLTDCLIEIETDVEIDMDIDID